MASKTAHFCPFCNQQPQESGLYYLQSRYYDPETGRFINADAFAATGQGLLGNNMFAHCQNNPVVFIDPDGYCMEVGALLTWIDCKKSNCPTSRYYIENKTLRKVFDTLHALIWNLELSAGVGMGLYFETEILEMIGVQLGMYGNFTEFQIKDGKITWGQNANTAFNVSLLGLNFGTYESIFNANDGTVEQNSNIPFHSNDSFLYSDDTITIASIAIYPIIGGFSCELGFDVIQFTADLRELY